MPAFNAELGAGEAEAAHTCGRAAAQAFWFSTIKDRLPENVRRLCVARLREATANATGQCLEGNQTLTWRHPAGRS